MSEPYNVTIGWTMSADDAWLHGFRGLTVAQARERWAARGYNSADLTTLPTDAADADVVSGWAVYATWSNHPGPCAAFVGDPRLELHVVSGTTGIEHWTWATENPTVANPECVGTYGPGVSVWGEGYGTSEAPYSAFNHDNGSNAFSVVAGTPINVSAIITPYNTHIALYLNWVDSECGVISSSLIADVDLGAGENLVSGGATAPAGAIGAYLQGTTAVGGPGFTGGVKEVTITGVGSVDLPAVALTPGPQRLVTCDEWDGMNSVPQVLPDGVERV